MASGIRGIAWVACIAWAALPAGASEALFTSRCAACHDDVVHPRGLVYNTAGNAAIVSKVNSLGMGATGTPAEFESIAAYLDTVKPPILLAPVAAIGPTTIALRDIKVQAAELNAHMKIIAMIETVSPPR